MADLPTHSDTGADTGQAIAPGLSRNRKITLAVALGVVAVVAIVLHLTGVIGG